MKICLFKVKHLLAIFACVSVGVTIERASDSSINVDIDLNALVLYADAIFDACLKFISKTPIKFIFLMFLRCLTWCCPRCPTPITPIFTFLFNIANSKLQNEYIIMYMIKYEISF